MPTRVLAFESDPDFSRELNTQFRALGCEITVVDDVNLGLQAASVSKPDLILLTIELPRMSGYSVCNRIKRDADLKDIPLIILSSESTDQTFEQHRRLGTRAQDYIRKPVAFETLLEHVRSFITLGGAPSMSPDEDGIVIDDEIELTDEALISAPPSGNLTPSLRPIDDDIDDFAEHAFGAITSASNQPPSAESNRAGFPSAIPSSPKVPSNLSAQSHANDDGELARVQEDSRKLKAQLEEKERLLTEVQGELKELRRSSRAALNDASEIENLRRELQELKSKPAASIKPSGGPSAREFLDLREQLNKKDKELLDLRDQITHKDKELLNLRDSSLALEREKADLSDKVDEQGRQYNELQKLAEANKNDKEAAAKRAEDFKRKSEKLTGQIEEKAAELEKAATRHSEELRTRDAEREKLVSDHEAALSARDAEREKLASDHEVALKARDAERDRLASEHATALENARGEYVRALADAEREARDALEKALTDARSAAETSERNAVEAERQRAADRERTALAELEERLRSELSAEKREALERLQSEKQQSESQRDQRIAELESHINESRSELQRANATLSEHAQQIASLEATLAAVRGDLERANQTVHGRDERIATLESELIEQRNELSNTLETLAAERQKFTLAVEKWNEDQASLDKVKDALAAALVQVESIEQRPMP